MEQFGEKYLNPITDSNPVGDDVRYSQDYDDIKEARREDDASLPQGVWEQELKVADWNKVFKLTSNILETKSKDLQVAVWLTEALIKLNSFRGLANGLDLIYKLCLKYWDTIYPIIDNDDLEYRMVPFEQLNGKNIGFLIKEIKITKPGSTKTPYNWHDFEQTMAKDNNPKATKNQKDNEIFSKALYEESVAQTPFVFYDAMYNDLLAIAETIKNLETIFADKCDEAPYLRNLQNLAEQITLKIKEYRDFKKTALTSNGEDSLQADTAQESILENAVIYNLPAPIRTREDAYAKLTEAADFLAKIEPHSPVPHLLKRAVHWGSLSFEELLTEIVENKNNLAEIYKVLGINPAVKK